MRAQEEGAPPMDEPANTSPPEPGTRVVLELTEAPETVYGGALRDEASVAYGSLLAELRRRGVVYDAHLGKAAREVAFQHSFFAGTLPREPLEFFLRAAGATQRTVLEAYTATNAKGDEALVRRAESLLASDALAGEGPLHLGIGEAYVPGAAMPRFIAILAARTELEVEPAPRQVGRGGVWTLEGRLPPGYERPSALVLYPSGQLENLRVESAPGDRRFSLRVPAGDAAGVLEVSLSASGPLGPKPLLQLPVMVDVPLPRRLATALPPDESSLEDATSGADLAFRLLNGLRAQRGLPTLIRDGALDRIARAHSVDMWRNHFFGHRSPSTGDVGDRLRQSGYRATAYAENLARAAGLHEAHSGLYASLGHRRNMLDANVTHVGLGAVRVDVEQSGPGPRLRDWLVTQVFSKPVLPIDADAELARLWQRVQEQRRSAGGPPLRRTARLDGLCAGAASAAARGDGDVLGPLNRAAGAPGGSWAWLVSTTDLRQTQLPAELGEARWDHVGLGLFQAPGDEHGVVRVVLLLARGGR